MFLMGRELIDDGSSEKEEKLYENLKLGVRTRRISFSFLIMTLVYLASYLAYKSYISVALLSFSLLAIINSSYIGHFLFIIIINSISVFVYTGFDKNFNGLGLAAYAFVIILSFFIYKKIETEKNELKPIGYKNYLIKSIRAFMGLFIIYSLYSLALPEKITFFNKKSLSKKISQIGKKKEKKTEKLLGHLERLAKVILLFSGIFFLLLLLRKNKKLSDSKLDKEVINDLILGVKKIQRKKLSPNEEIIESYNVFKETMKKIEYDDIEVPPPKILFEHILKGSKRFEDETWFVTDIFCNCYYGQKEANSQELSIFRKSFLRVIRSL